MDFVPFEFRVELDDAMSVFGLVKIPRVLLLGTYNGYSSLRHGEIFQKNVPSG